MSGCAAALVKTDDKQHTIEVSYSQHKGVGGGRCGGNNTLSQPVVVFTFKNIQVTSQHALGLQPHKPQLQRLARFNSCQLFHQTGFTFWKWCDAHRNPAGLS